MFFLYNILWTLIAILFFPLFILYTLITGKKRNGLWHFFGIFTQKELQQLSSQKKKIWIFALSMGEVIAITPVLKKISEQSKDIVLIVSTTTESGYQYAKNSLPFIDLLTYTPFDTFFCVAKAYNTIKPDMVIITETGLWPNIITYGRRYGALTFLVHGRISEKSFARYRLIKKSVATLFNHFDFLYMQNDYGINQVVTLGVSKEKVTSIGDTKFDTLQTLNSALVSTCRQRFSLAENTLTIIAGSTHEGEEEVIIEVFTSLRKKFPLLLIIAPRRLERIEEIEKLLNEKKLPFDRAAELPEKKRSQDIILLNTMGELSKVYSIGTIIFVGRSLFKPGGGHSLIEPAAFGKMVFHGPYMEYNQDIADRLDKEGIGVQVTDKKDMLKKMTLYLKSSASREEIKKKAEQFIENNRGASARLAKIFLSRLTPENTMTNR